MTHVYCPSTVQTDAKNTLHPLYVMLGNTAGADWCNDKAVHLWALLPKPRARARDTKADTTLRAATLYAKCMAFLYMQIQVAAAKGVKMANAALGTGFTLFPMAMAHVLDRAELARAVQVAYACGCHAPCSGCLQQRAQEFVPDNVARVVMRDRVYWQRMERHRAQMLFVLAKVRAQELQPKEYTTWTLGRAPLAMDIFTPRGPRAVHVDYSSYPQDPFHGDGITKTKMVKWVSEAMQVGLVA